ncbi:MAG: peptide ABC transporter substrate-binding protein [Fimbriimonadales bacterium]|nr:peptide ABC transporter substrate-binding protein [Fimbriimonadales bacterium]
MVRWLVALAALSMLAAGCGTGTKQAEPGGAKVFRYPIVTSPTTLDPGMVQDGDTIDLIQQVFEGLVCWGEDNQVKPNLAESWELSQDGRTYTFKLRKGVKFHNGRELTAEDVKFSFERHCDPAFKSPVAETYLSDIVGVKEKLRGQASEVTGVQVVGPHEVRITIDSPKPYFLGKLTYPTAFVVCREAVKEGQEIRSVAEMVGTGPFRAKEYLPDQLMVLEAFRDYHAGAPKVDRLERPVVKDAQTRLNMFRAGQIDLLVLERQDVEAVQRDPVLKSQLQFFDRPGIWYIGMAPKADPLFANRAFRRAIAMAIDRKQIVEQTLRGLVTPAESIVPPGVLGHRPKAAVLPFDVEAAKRELARSGVDPRKVKLELTFREQRPDIKLVAEDVAGQLKKNLGLEVTLRTMEWKAYLERHQRGEIGFFHMRWMADYLDPQNFLSTMLATYGPENTIGYANAEFDALCRKADVSLDERERLELYAKAEDIALQDAPWIPIYFQRDPELISPRVKGLRTSLFGHLPHYTVSVD